MLCAIIHKCKHHSNFIFWKFIIHKVQQLLLWGGLPHAFRDSMALQRPPSLELVQVQQIICVKGQVINIFDFVGHTVSVITTQLYYYSTKASINKWASCIPVRPYFQKSGSKPDLAYKPSLPTFCPGYGGSKEYGGLYRRFSWTSPKTGIQSPPGICRVLVLRPQITQLSRCSSPLYKKPSICM